MPERRGVPDGDWRPYVVGLGRRIAALRKDLGWSQTELAHVTGLAVNSVKLIEVGKSSWEGADARSANPTLDTLCLFAVALGVTPAELLAPLGTPNRALTRDRHAVHRPQPSRIRTTDRAR